MLEKNNTEQGGNMSNTVEKVISVAMDEVGYLEKSKTAYMKDKTILDKKTEGAGSDNYTKYGRDMHALYPAVMDFPAYWCDCFVDWCFQKAYGVSNAKALLGGNFDDYTVNSKALYVKKNAYHKEPQVGDQIFFKNSQRVCHTGLVYKVDNKYVYTIEGNTSGGSTVVSNGGGVSKKKYALTNTKIDGYGRPKYDIADDKAAVEPDTVRGVVTATALNVRTGPGTEFDNIKSYPVIHSGDEVLIKGSSKAKNGDTWYYICISGKHGYASAKHIKRIG